jgi:hypothetical protein
MSEPKHPPKIDLREFAPAGMGLAIGLGILAALVALGLAVGLTPSLQFGIPFQ